MATNQITVGGGNLITSHIRSDSFQSQISRTSNFTSVSITICERLKEDNPTFIQLDAQSDMSIVYDSLVGDCGKEKHEPTLILSVYGGAKYFIMTEKLEKEILRGIIEAATTTGIEIYFFLYFSWKKNNILFQMLGF
jgi:hypothetical protein